MKKHLAPLFLSFFSAGTLFADVEIHMQAADGGITSFWIGEERVKMSSPEDDAGFVIVDVKDQKQYMVDHNEQMVIDVTGGLEGASAQTPSAPPQTEPDKVAITIEKTGEGPTIAGFISDKYEVKADGVLCSEEYLSIGPFRHPEIVKLLKVMTLIESADIGNNELYSPCEQADMALERQYQSLGMPLKSVGADGVVNSAVVFFKIHPAPEGTYDFPPGYTKTSLREMLNEMQPSEQVH